ncbi:hypothetical protein KBJ98_03360 [Flavobacterium sp. F-328]|uniref:Uncharacterized protein n=1 Tax=Flavobacterium erciyesense TaxID=2825842 RepID=A0ABS5D152_9FLAO|nr:MULTISPECIES: hypothetical protein [Flavobacterium]MBB1194114.1 hypothetical protein [Flavobacterium sp. SOK18b]MBQ0907737.1 hypothetical protein [Flavobacterium erciyesense]
MEFSEINMIVEMNSFVEFYSEDDERIFENNDFEKLRKELNIKIDICEIHKSYYSDGKIGFNENTKVYFSDLRLDTFILLDIGDEDLVNLVIRYPKVQKDRVKSFCRNFFDRTKIEVFYLEGTTKEKNSEILTDLNSYPKKIEFLYGNYYKDIEFYQMNKKLEKKIDLKEIYIWPFTKEK